MENLIFENNIKDINISGSYQFVDRFFGQDWKKTIIVDSGSILDYLCVMVDSNLDLDFKFLWENSKINIFCIFFGKNDEKLKSKISVFLDKSRLYANTYLLCIARDGTNIDVNWNIDIWSGVSSVEWYLQQEQVVLWKGINIKMTPSLIVKSNDVKASHGAKIDKLNEQSLFYMMTKGLDIDISQRLVLEWYYHNILDKFDSFDWEYRDSLLKYLVEQSFVN